MKKKRIAINGFGRIGRAITKINHKYKLFDLALVNDKNPHVDNLAYLFKYDSTISLKIILALSPTSLTFSKSLFIFSS